MALVVGSACRDAPATLERPIPETPGAGPPSRTPGPASLSIRGTRFHAGDAPFEWRGITAFALVEQIAHGRGAEAEAYLKWAAGQRLTVVRVLTMAEHLFKLTPDEGRAALPHLLEIAAAHGLYVEVVALADTAATPVDLEAHVKAIGAIAGKHSNALIEIANEPGHSTQRRDVRDPQRLRALANLVPEGIPVALGSAEYDDAFAAGDYATYHFPRDGGEEGWGHVLRLAEGASLVTRWGKPVVNDEPIGAAPQFVAGRRDNDPARFAAAALLSRLAGLYPTFHYDAGLLAKVPTGRELESLNAWTAALRVGERVAWQETEFLHGEALGALVRASGARAVFARAGKQEAWILLVDAGPTVSVEWMPGWQAAGEWDVPGARLLRGRLQQ